MECGEDGLVVLLLYSILVIHGGCRLVDLCVSQVSCHTQFLDSIRHMGACKYFDDIRVTGDSACESRTPSLSSDIICQPQPRPRTFAHAAPHLDLFIISQYNVSVSSSDTQYPCATQYNSLAPPWHLAAEANPELEAADEEEEARAHKRTMAYPTYTKS